MPDFLISVSDIDYGAAAELLLEMAGEKKDESKALKLLTGMGSLPKKAADVLPQSVKDELLVALVNGLRSKLIGEVESKAAAKGIRLTVKDISARKSK